MVKIVSMVKIAGVVCEGLTRDLLVVQALSVGIVSVGVTSSVLVVVSGTAVMRAWARTSMPVAASFGPFVVLFGEHGDEADQ